MSPVAVGGASLDPTTAVAKLAQSQLSNQLELLRDDITVDDFNLQLPARHAVKLRESITDIQVARTITGASTVTATVADRDGALLASGIFGDTITLSKFEKTALGAGVSFVTPVDVEIDGLWFRLANMTQQDPDDRTLSLVFEDREVAVLRLYPKVGTPAAQAIKVVPSNVMTRAQFMVSLIQEAQEIQGGIRYVVLVSDQAATGLNGTKPIDHPSKAITPAVRTVLRKGGFAPKATLKVKTETATPTQRDNLQRVLDVGESMHSTADELLAAVITVIQENSANKLSSKYLPYVGIFSQNSDPKTSAGTHWIGIGGASGVVENDAHAFFTDAKSYVAKHPFAAPADIALNVQNPGGPASQYGQWLDQAKTIVGAYKGSDDLSSPSGAIATEVGALSDLRGSFHRGSVVILNGRSQFVRESNWACLTRLAQEVGWRVFCVSGTIYIADDHALFGGAVQFVASEDDPSGVTIGFSVDTGKAHASVTVNCRASRWQAPPGSVAAVQGKGSVDGKWLVSNIQRSLFKTATVVTLTKPQPSLPDAESADPVLSGTQVLAASGKGVRKARATVAADARGVRAAIIAAAEKAFKLANSSSTSSNYQYNQGGDRSSRTSLFGPPYPINIDCSSFVTLCYKQADAPDPNGLGYTPLGYTGSLAKNGTKTNNPQPGDILLYDPYDDHKRGHAQLYIGDGMVIQAGGHSYPTALQKEAVDISALLGPGAFSHDYFAGFYTYNLGPLG